MATKEDLHAVAGKALADPGFRQKLLDDPEAAVKEAGFELTEEQIEALKAMDRQQFEQGLGELDERLTMSCWGRTLGNNPIPMPREATMPGPLPSIKPCGWD